MLIKIIIFAVIIYFVILSPIIQWSFIFTQLDDDKKSFQKTILWYLIMFFLPIVVLYASSLFTFPVIGNYGPDATIWAIIIALVKNPTKNLSILADNPDSIKLIRRIGSVLLIIGSIVGWMVLFLEYVPN
tara:strand:+ start:513 stop:902 length:390 start_codon:yes stop_codon:yes gene_type:complete